MKWLSEEEAIKKVDEFLRKMDLKFKYLPEDKVFVIPFYSEATGRRFDVLVIIRGNWVTTAAIAVKKDELPKDLDERAFYKLLLNLTFELNEVTYGLTKNGDVVAHAESHVKALSFENFRIEFNSVVFGVEYLVREVLPKYPRVEVPDYYSKLFYLA